MAPCEREKAEILVFGQKYSFLRPCDRENGFVPDARTEFHDRGHVVAGRPKSRHDTEVAALIGEEPHRLVSVGIFADEDDFLASESVSGVAHRRMNVLTREARVALKKVGLGRTLAQLAQDKFNRDSGSLTTGFPSITRGFTSIRSVSVIGGLAGRLNSQDAPYRFGEVSMFDFDPCDYDRATTSGTETLRIAGTVVSRRPRIMSISMRSDGRHTEPV